MEKLNRDGALTYCRRDPFDRPVPDVPGREDTGHARFEQQRGPLERPSATPTGMGSPAAAPPSPPRRD